MQIWTWKGCLRAGRAAALFGAVLVALAAVAPVSAAEGAKVTLPE